MIPIGTNVTIKRGLGNLPIINEAEAWDSRRPHIYGLYGRVVDILRTELHASHITYERDYLLSLVYSDLDTTGTVISSRVVASNKLLNLVYTISHRGNMLLAFTDGELEVVAEAAHEYTEWAGTIERWLASTD